jgi:hypothetical protein
MAVLRGPFHPGEFCRGISWLGTKDGTKGEDALDLVGSVTVSGPMRVQSHQG